MRSQYFRDIKDQGGEEAWQLAFLVEQGHNIVDSTSYQAARDARTGKLETETSSQLTKLPMEKTSKIKRRRDHIFLSWTRNEA